MSHWRNSRGRQGRKGNPYVTEYIANVTCWICMPLHTDDIMLITCHLSLTLFVTIIMSAWLCPVVSHVLAATVEILKKQISQIKCWCFYRFFTAVGSHPGLLPCPNQSQLNKCPVTNNLYVQSDHKTAVQCDTITFTNFRSQPWSIYFSIPLSVGYQLSRFIE